MKTFERRTGRVLGAVLAAMLALLAAGDEVPAQGSFYVEIEKEDLIYVFNNMKSYEHWKTTGEMDESITRIGAGPEGQTIVFDSIEAIHMYNFRHGFPGEVIEESADPEPPRVRVDWKDGKTTIQGRKVKLSISNRIQFRFTDEMPEGEESQGSFRIRRGKTKFEGWIYNPDLEYALQLNWPDTSNALEDALINYDLSRGRDIVQIKAGQFKVPFGRQELTSSGKQQFVDRAIASSEFAQGRDIGLQFWGETPRGGIEWGAGIFNGNGRNNKENDNDRFQANGRVMWQPLGDAGYSESDFESSARPLLGVAADYEINDVGDPDPNTNGVRREVFGGDIVFKLRGLSVFTEYFRRISRPELTPEFETRGWTAQVGYFVYERHVEVAARYSTVEFTRDASAVVMAADDDRNEKGLALNWFMNKHNLKLQADYRRVEKELLDLTDDEYRLQMQLIF